MTTLLTGYFRGGSPPTSMTLTLAAPVRGNDPAAASRSGRAHAYGTAGGIAPGLYRPVGSHEVVGDSGVYGTTGGIAPGLYNPAGSHEDAETLHTAAVARLAAVDGNTTVGLAPFSGAASAVTYTPASTITGAATNSRTVSLVNTSNGNAVVATLAFVAGVNAPAGVAKVIPLSSTPADLVVMEGDVLQWQSVHVGSTGLADPGGSVSATVTTI